MIPVVIKTLQMYDDVVLFLLTLYTQGFDV